MQILAGGGDLCIASFPLSSVTNFALGHGILYNSLFEENFSFHGKIGTLLDSSQSMSNALKYAMQPTGRS